VSTRKLRRAVRLPEGDVPIMAGDGTSKSAASRRFVALSAERLAKWMASDLSKLDLLIIQINGLHIGNDLVLVAALGIDGNGDKHPLGLVEGRPKMAYIASQKPEGWVPLLAPDIVEAILGGRQPAELQL
jgi:putative transposase